MRAVVIERFGGSATVQEVPDPQASPRGVAVVGTDVRNWSLGDRVTVPFVVACGRGEVCRSGNGVSLPRTGR